MRYAIIGDIHGNLAAFKAVLADVEHRGGVDELWCLGDVVGYGPEPEECLNLLQQYQHCCVAGNHDWAAIGKIDTSDFNAEAALACRWTAAQLSQRSIEYLGNLPLRLCRGEFTLVHGSPREPVWEYLLSAQDAAENLEWFETPHCLIAHSHIPLLFRCSAANRICHLCKLFESLSLEQEGIRLIVNPGGVGQPRDGDSRASYALIDTERKIFCHYRVDYDVNATQNKMIQAGLPHRLATRLSYGW